MQRMLRTLALAALTTALPLAAKTLEVVTPSRGVTLRGGTFASIEWRADQLPRGSEEWEAFLSADGGHYYAFRITPHLDIELRRFTFIVPNVATRNARILIRTGDEVRETLFEMPVSFTIVHDPHAEEILPRQRRLGHAEAAREGDPEVLDWTDGDRNGAGVSQPFAAATPSQSLGVRPIVSNESSTFLAPNEIGVRIPQVATVRQPAIEKHVLDAASRRLPVNILLVCRRRNI